MNQLEEARGRIDEIDKQWAALFEKRMEQVAAVAEYKRTHGLPVLDAVREQEASAALLAGVSPNMRPYVEQLHSKIVELSRAYQCELLKNLGNTVVSDACSSKVDALAGGTGSTSTNTHTAKRSFECGLECNLMEARIDE